MLDQQYRNGRIHVADQEKRCLAQFISRINTGAVLEQLLDNILVPTLHDGLVQGRLSIAICSIDNGTVPEQNAYDYSIARSVTAGGYQRRSSCLIFRVDVGTLLEQKLDDSM
jgi:hypothetical protein